MLTHMHDTSCCCIAQTPLISFELLPPCLPIKRGPNLPLCVKGIYAGGQLAFSAPPWPGISPEAKSCVSRLLESDAGRRATPAEILQHPWLVQHGVALLEPFEHVVVQRMRQARLSALSVVSQPGRRLSSCCCTSLMCSDAALAPQS